MTTLFISHSLKDKAWAERMHQVLSDSDYQCLFLDSHPEDGIHAGADWERTLYQRLRQSRCVIVLCTANWLASPWCIAEAMIVRERGMRPVMLATADVVDGRQVKGAHRPSRSICRVRAFFRSAGETAPQIPDFLKDTQFISLSGVTEERAHQLLLQGLEREGLRKKDFKLPVRPYPGLDPSGRTTAPSFLDGTTRLTRSLTCFTSAGRATLHPRPRRCVGAAASRRWCGRGCCHGYGVRVATMAQLRPG